MPLLDGPRSNETVSGNISHDVSHGQNPNNTSRDVTEHNVNRRQKIVVVGLGMVAISFMYVVTGLAKK